MVRFLLEAAEDSSCSPFSSLFQWQPRGPDRSGFGVDPESTIFKPLLDAKQQRPDQEQVSSISAFHFCKREGKKIVSERKRKSRIWGKSA